ncbi:uncharacterized protein prr36a [Leuresthes tenuis]|uniref:uncharacterized protein prr36a n=1 Tax=Leuresthes tenuis TaxID=355514 RepID=UPI003B50C3D1
MKPDGVTMETTEPSHSDAAAESSSLPENVTEEAQSQLELASNNAAPVAAPKANGKPQAAEPKVKPKGVGNKTQCTASAGVSGSSSRPGTASHRTVTDSKCSVTGPAGKKAATMTTSKAAGAVPKRPVGVAATSSTAKNQIRVSDKKPVGPARTTSGPAATVTNGTKSTTVNDASKKRPATGTVNGARPKTTATAGRAISSTVPKPTTSAATKPVGAATSKTTRPATVPSTSRTTSTTSRPTSATAKPSTIATAKTAPSRVATAPSTGRTTATQPPKTATAAKKDVSRPPSTAVAKKPTPATASPATKKGAAAVRLNAASKGSTPTKVDAKALQSKPQQPAKPTPTKKPVAAARFPLTSKPPGSQTPPASPANRPANGSAPTTKRGTKPTRTVPPFTATKKMEVSKTTKHSAETQSTAPAVAAATIEAVETAETLAEAAVALPQESSLAASAQEVSTNGSAQHTITEVEPQAVTQNNEATLSPPQSPVTTNVPQTCLEEQSENGTPFSTKQEQIVSSAKPTLPSEACPPELPEETVVKDKTMSKSTALFAAANTIPQTVPPASLDEEEDEEEREGSQLVSVSEMSGTTQPTEDSRPGSGGTVGGSAWRAGGALLSELDSEEVSGSQQGASELSAPGVLEGTESMDDLGDGSLKGAIDMEGASAGSPDFEKVPDIPVNDFDEDEDDSDRVCDMDVGSERTDEPRRARHDNDVDEEDDDDVEMASEGVTESGLESYGNADEDDFAEDERLDNLNRVAQPPPLPPVLPSAPAAQWDQPNPFADPWAEPTQFFQLAHVAGAVAANPLAEPWQEEPKIPKLTPAQAWLEQGLENQAVPYSSVKAELKNEEAGASVQTLGSDPISVPKASLSSILSSETSMPEDLGGCNHDGKLPSQVTQANVLSPQPDPDCQGLGIHLEQGEKEAEEEAEPETLPADEILGGPATAPTSNPSSSTATEDEASDTEGEAQLEDSVETPAVNNITFECQPPAQHSLSTVEEGEEPEREELEGGVSEDATPPSAASLASYGFDTVTTASNSNAQSTGESCIKSPGIFSLEELPEEVKQLHTEQCLAEQQYIECGKQEADSAEHVGEEALDPSLALNTAQQPEEIPDDVQPPYYSAICEKTEESFAGLAVLHPHRRDHSAYPRTYYDLVKPLSTAVALPKLTCADLPPRNPGQQALSPQLRRLEQHQRQLLELQQRREQQSRPLEEAEQERKRRVEEEERKKKEEAEEEIKRNKEEERKKQAEMTKKEEKLREEELKQRRDLELQLQQQQQELKQRQQIMQWQQELQQSKGQTILLSPSSGLCTIYEALENSDEEAEDEQTHEQDSTKDKKSKQAVYPRLCDSSERMRSEDERQHPPLIDSPPSCPDSTPASSNLSQDEDGSSFFPTESPERPPPLDLDWGKKVDIVQQLINQTLLLNGDGCSSLLLLPGGTGGKLSPLESSLWPSLVPPLTPPSATVTSVSSFSPEATGSSPQGEWTVVELETHH